MTPFIFKYMSGISLKTIYSIFILFSMLLYFLHLDNGLPEEELCLLFLFIEKLPLFRAERSLSKA